jgi:hypothetical protein
VTKPPLRLEIFQSLWAMQLRRPDGVELSDEAVFDKVAGAGYDGVCIDLSVTDMATARGLIPLIRRYKLGCTLTAFPTRFGEFPAILQLAEELEVRYLDIICQIMPVDTAAGVPVLFRLMEMAEAAGIEMHLETHRNSLSNDMFAMLQLLDSVPDLLVSADLSHYVVGREFYLPLPDTTEAQIHRILDRAESFQGRIATNQQIQVPVDFPQHKPWLDLFLGWWETGFRLWRRHRDHRPGRVLNFLCELGPAEYAITDAQGWELSDRWTDALSLRDHARAIWARLDAEDAGLAQ